MILLYMRCRQGENHVCPWFFSVEFFEKLCQFKFHNVIGFESRIRGARCSFYSQVLIEEKMKEQNMDHGQKFSGDSEERIHDLTFLT